MVGLYYQASVTLPSCILGILQAGASFAPIDPKAPRDVSVHFIRSLELHWVLLPTSLEQAFIQKYGETFEARLAEDSVILADTCYRLVELLANGRCHRRCPLVGVHLAYAMHTSGTTGKPKIVRVPHQSIVPNILHLSSIFNIAPSDTIFMASPLTFDPSVVELFLALSSGASLLMVTDVVKLAPRRLMDALLRNQVSVLQATPTLVHRFGADLLRRTLLSATTRLRVLAFGGEACPSLAQIGHMRAADNTTTRCYNLYGITEVSSWATCHRIGVRSSAEDTDKSIPLGQPLAGTTLEVRNDNGQTITEGSGQLFIGSHSRVCLLDGEAWPVPLSGPGGVMRATGDEVRFTGQGLVFVGRRDDQVKRNGKRFSLSQVKQTIQTLPGVESCHLLLRRDGRLLLFCSRSQTAQEQTNGPPTPAASREALGDLLRGAPLPTHCLPDDVYLLDRLPATSHGKVDQEALLRHASEAEARRGDAERLGGAKDLTRAELAALWQRAARSASLPLDSTLFVGDSGGDSFQAVQLAESVESRTGLALPSLLDLILHAPFADVHRLVQDRLLEERHTGVRTGSGTAASPSERTPQQKPQLVSLRSGTSFPEARACPSFLEKPLDGGEASTRRLSLKSARPDADLAVESEHQPCTKRPKATGPNGKEDPSMNTVTDASVVFTGRTPTPSGTVSCSHPTTRLSETAGCSSPDTVGPPPCEHCAAVQDCLWEICRAKRDPHCGLVSRTKHAIRRCSQWVTARQTESEPHAGQSTRSTDSLGVAAPDHKSSSLMTGAQQHQASSPRARDGLLSAEESPGTASGRRGDLTCRCPRLLRAQQQDADSGASDDSRWPSESPGVAAAPDQADPPGQSLRLKLSENWRYDTGKCVDASPLVATNCRGSEAVVYIGSHSHRFAAVSMATGKALWVTELGNRIESSACLSLCGSKVIVGCYDNCLYSLDASAGTVLWTFETQGPIKSSPVTDGNTGVIYVGSHDQHLYALDVEEQRCQWRLHCQGGSVFSSPAVHHATGTLYVGTLAGLLLSVNKETGAIRWTFNCHKPLFSSVATTRDFILCGCVDGQFYCVSQLGDELWHFQTEAPIFSSACVPPAISDPQTTPDPPWHSDGRHQQLADPCVVFGSHDEHVYCLSLLTGALRWRRKMTSAVYASPFIFQRGRRGILARSNLREGASNLNIGPEPGFKAPDMTHRPALYRNSIQTLPACHRHGDGTTQHGSHGRWFVAVCSTEGTVAILDLGSGEVTASCRLPGQVFSSPVVVGDSLVVGCRDDYVYHLQIV